MKNMVQFIVIIAFSFISFVMPATAADIDPPFDSLHWKARPIVITGPDYTKDFQRQMEMFRVAADGLFRRDITLIHFHDNTIETFDALSAVPYNSPIDPGEDGKDDRAYLERSLRTDDDIFSVVLVGKDGTVKQVWQDEPIDPDVIFNLIDSMPMRQEEMQNRREMQDDGEREPFEMLK